MRVAARLPDVFQPFFIGFPSVLPKEKERKKGITKREKRSKSMSSLKIIKGMGARVREYLRPFGCLSKRIRTGALPNNRFGGFEVFRCTAPLALLKFICIAFTARKNGDADDNRGDGSWHSATHVRTSVLPYFSRLLVLPSSTRDTAIMSSNVLLTKWDPDRESWRG